jgi:anti-sigma factor RsiW
MITRDNYEEFFLLYIDNELPISDRRAVERFVSDHPDLREEWETLLQCRIVPEQHLAFPGRDALHQREISAAAEDPGGRPAGTRADGPDFLSYIDGELGDKDRQAVEEFVRRNPQAAAELERWRLTISYPDPALVFPDKASLYKKESNRKIILLPWVRVGAAAAIIGIAVLLWLMPRPAHREGMTAAPARPGGIGAAAGPQATTTFRPPVMTAPEHPAGTPSDRPATPSSEQPATASSGQPAALPVTRLRNKKNDPAVTPATTAALYDTGERNGEEAGNPVALRTPEKIQPAGRQEIGAKEIGTNVSVVAQQIGIPREESSFATQALQNETNDPENNSLVADEPASAGKARLRGIFRKVTRVFGKTADRDKDGQREVLIGAFQFALK